MSEEPTLNATQRKDVRDIVWTILRSNGFADGNRVREIIAASTAQRRADEVLNGAWGWQSDDTLEAVRYVRDGPSQPATTERASLSEDSPSGVDHIDTREPDPPRECGTTLVSVFTKDRPRCTLPRGHVGEHYYDDSGRATSTEDAPSVPSPEQNADRVLSHPRAPSVEESETPWPGFCQTCKAPLDPPDAISCRTCGCSDADE
jgi:hypothetical protein